MKLAYDLSLSEYLLLNKILCSTLPFLSYQVMSEILTGIRVIKFYAWESNFIRKILQLR